MNKQHVAILGSTGSIGRQALEVIESYGDFFTVETLTARNNWQLLIEQALRYRPNQVVISEEDHYQKVKEALEPHFIKVYAGTRALEQVVESTETDVVVSALVGSAGLFPTVNAIRHGKKIAMANKETLVVAGELVMQLAQENKVPILPVDSEHSAVFQCLAGEKVPLEKIILTASGGPFREFTAQQMKKVTPAQALAHPNWSMGDKITIDSASMMNKGFEVIEARWLFGVQPRQIEVLIHPQSIIHSMVQFADGAVKAQLGIPDMKLPIQYALTFPYRLPMQDNRFDFSQAVCLELYPPRPDQFPCLELAYQALKRGGNTCCIMNAANEIGVQAFLSGQIGFTDLPRLIERTIESSDFIARPTLDDYRECDRYARARATELLKSI